MVRQRIVVSLIDKSMCRHRPSIDAKRGIPICLHIASPYPASLFPCMTSTGSVFVNIVPEPFHISHAPTTGTGIAKPRRHLGLLRFANFLTGYTPMGIQGMLTCSHGICTSSAKRCGESPCSVDSTAWARLLSHHYSMKIFIFQYVAVYSF
jgi:hypothetical protein